MAPGIAAVSLPEGLIEWWQAATVTLGERPVSTLLEAPVVLDPAPEGPDKVHLLIERGPKGDLQLGGATASLAGLLAAADAPSSRQNMIRRATELGAEAEEASDIIQSLVEEGLLVEGMEILNS